MKRFNRQPQKVLIGLLGDIVTDPTATCWSRRTDNLVATSNCSAPGRPTRMGRRNAGRREDVGYLNFIAATLFMGQVLGYAEEYRQGKADWRNRRREAPDAAGNDPREEGT